MTLLLNTAQLVLYIALWALAGQGVLFVILGAARQSNVVYQLFQVVNRPWRALARWLPPLKPAGRRQAWGTFVLTAVLYAGVTLAKIAHCLNVAMVGCR